MSHIVNQNFLHIRNTRACALENPMFGSMTSRIFTTPERGGGTSRCAVFPFPRDSTEKGEAGWNRGGAFAERQKKCCYARKEVSGFFPMRHPFPSRGEYSQPRSKLPQTGMSLLMRKGGSRSLAVLTSVAIGPLACTHTSYGNKEKQKSVWLVRGGRAVRADCLSATPRVRFVLGTSSR